MSHAASNYVKHLVQGPNGQEISVAEKGVLMQLADDHNEDQGYAFPSVRHLARRARMSEQYCRRLLRQLEAKGVIETMPNIRDNNGGRTSSNYRFCQIDPPFDHKRVVHVKKTMELQRRVNAAQKAVQPTIFAEAEPDPAATLSPQPHAHPPSKPEFRGGRNSSFGPLETTVAGGTKLEDGGGRNSSFGGTEPLTEPQGQPLLESLAEPKNPLPPAAQGVELTPEQLLAEDTRRWEGMKRRLKEELCSVPLGVAKAKGFTEIVPGENDYDACFRDWWLHGVRRVQEMVIVTTRSANRTLTMKGEAKYSARLKTLVRDYFGLPPATRVQFVVAPAEPVVLAEPAAELVDDNAWEQVKRELFTRLCKHTGRERDDKTKWFREVVKPVVLREVVAEDEATVWTLEAADPKRAEQIFDRLRTDLTHALCKIAGANVQLRVVKSGGE